MSDEQSASGAPVFRHDQPAEVRISRGDPDLIGAVEAHLSAHAGTPGDVWHEVVSDQVHVDVHAVAPTEERPVWTLLTSGMAERPTDGPDGPARTELTLLLPGDWPAPGADEAALWPYTLLQDLARMPHLYGFHLGAGHTLPNGDPAEAYAPGTGLACALFASPLLAPEGFERFAVRGEPVDVLGVILLHPEEMQLKLDEGMDALADRLDAADVSELLHPDRPSSVARKRWWRR